MTTRTNSTITSTRRDSVTTGSTFGPITVGMLGLMIVAAAFVAQIVAGLAAGDLFDPTGGAVSDRGVWMATQAWATPLALTGLAVLFAGAVPYALRNVGSSIACRRDAMTDGLATIISSNSISPNSNPLSTLTKETLR